PDPRKLVGGLLLGQRKAQRAKKAVLELPIVQLNCSYLVLFSSAWSRGGDQPPTLQLHCCIAALQAYKVHSGRMLWGGVKTEACPRQPRSVQS
ncbi:hypothetical protein, partial [Stutzerimonas kunmingensis]|uniref:hypothetical protein n=1 Tax=Stutzerimonas kunmingensis TaxID=1211807 RepID=UPI0030DDB63E